MDGFIQAASMPPDGGQPAYAISGAIAAYDNAKAESFMKTLKAEEVYLRDYETFENVTADLPHFLDEAYNHRRLPAALGSLRATRREAGRD